MLFLINPTPATKSIGKILQWRAKIKVISVNPRQGVAEAFL
jgi:hypothetical protein